MWYLFTETAIKKKNKKLQIKVNINGNSACDEGGFVNQQFMYMCRNQEQSNRVEHLGAKDWINTHNLILIECIILSK